MTVRIPKEFMELLRHVVEIAVKAIRFKQSLANLESTLTRIGPVIKEIEQDNNVLGRSPKELEPLVRKMEEGTNLVLKCSTVRSWCGRIRHHKQLDEFENWLRTLLVELIPPMARDVKEILIENKTQGMGSSSIQGSTIVIGSKYCTPLPMALKIVRKVKKLGFPDKFSVQNPSNDIIFNLERPYFSIHKRFTLFDGENNPIVTLHKKRMTTHHRWEVFRGESRHKDDLLFSVKQHHVIQREANLDVFLASNPKEDLCDFKVQRSWSGRSYTVGVQSHNIAQIDDKRVAPRTFGFTEESVEVRVKANVDHAFIVNLEVLGTRSLI
ncbi:hypothetical protein Fmac_012040 [Flemingia macrophylla]|uniref:RPW8 domain-containing protein n=1 Tax=Flemingia macrophylla TaxID=520843 RepID=A0ABD1MP67_9FABA